jgi:hypothetical protein
MYTFSDLADGTWTFEVEMLCFTTVKQDVTVGSEATIPDFELKLLPLDEIKAQAVPQQAPSPVSVAMNTLAAAPAADSADAAKAAKKSKKTPPPPANTPGGFQRADVKASTSGAAKQSNATAAAATFVQKGIPALYLMGGPLDPAVEERMAQWQAKHYHMPTDSIQPGWNWEGPRQVAELGFEIGRQAADQNAMPQWRPGSEFNHP